MRRRTFLILISVSAACLFAWAGNASAGERRADRPPWRPHIADAKRYAERRAGEVAVAVIDQRGRLRGFGMRTTAPAASVFKVMLLVAYLRERHGSRISRSDRRLLGPMIRSSDDVAATRVRDLVGQRRIERLARLAGMRDFEYEWV